MKTYDISAVRADHYAGQLTKKEIAIKHGISAAWISKLAYRHGWVKKPGGYKPTSREVRFWKKVQRRSDAECWLWLGFKKQTGHGQLHIGRSGETDGAHRVSWEIAYGKIPDGMCVCHKCDNPPCVNPSHLFLGSQLDNLSDMTAKGRRCHGEAHSNSKLTAEQVMSIRKRTGYKWADLALEFGVSETTIRDAAKGVTWRHVTDA